jgi:hypothetical protein
VHALALSVSCAVLSGCVAVWGQAHNVVSADESGITIQYDRSLTSTARTQVLAREHCKKFGKSAEPASAEMPGILLGIIEERYLCIDSKPAS